MKLAPALAILAVSMSQASWGDTLPAATVDQYLQWGFLQRQDSAILGPSSMVAGEGSVANYNNSYTPNPSVSTSLSTVNLSNKDADSAGSSIYYSFEIVDSTSSAASPVNLDVDYSWGASSNGPANQQFSASLAMLILNPADSSVPLLLQPCVSNYAPQCTAGQSFSTSATASAAVLTNTVYSLDIGVGVTSYGSSQTVTAYLDPYLHLAQANSDLSIELSPGIGNVSAVPEPSIAFLMLAGLSVLGVRRLRNRSNA